MTPGPNSASAVPRRLPLLLLVLTALVTLYYLARGLWMAPSYWLDELYSVTAADGTLHETLRIAFHDVHPPLYYLTLRAWAALFGLSEVATRSLSALFALGAVASLLLLRDRLPRETLAVVAALMLANAYLQVHAQEARANAMLMCLVTLGFAAAATGRWRLVLAARDLWTRREQPAGRVVLQALALIAGTIAGVVLIGLHTPITLARSFMPGPRGGAGAGWPMRCWRSSCFTG